jgi:FAD/FMN-containing dehydrogenase
VVRPEKLSQVPRVVLDRRYPSVLARGLGRSYGDASLNDQGATVLLERLDRMLAFDPASGLLRCEAGVSFHDIVATFLPRGWFVPVTPGTRFVTLGGAVACDVHGKNHHCDGSLGRHLRSLDLVLASGQIVRCSPHEQPDLFYATLGGMGLTGLVVEVEMQLMPVRTNIIRRRIVPARDLDHLLEQMDVYDRQYRYSVAWIDCLAQGGRPGRGILILGDHALPDDLPPVARHHPLAFSPGRARAVPCEAPDFLLNNLTVKAFNELYYQLNRRRAGESLASLREFFWPLDSLLHWNRLYGRRGFLQYQMVVPPQGGPQALAAVLELCARRGWGSFLAVLKRFGPGLGWLSFPMPGYTLTMDFPVRPGLFELLSEIDRLVLEAGGRVYLGKDARLAPEHFRAMYPDLPRWLEVKRRVDPGSRFSSLLSRRLGIDALVAEGLS